MVAKRRSVHRKMSAGARGEMRENKQIDQMIGTLKQMKKHNSAEMRHMKKRR